MSVRCASAARPSRLRAAGSDDPARHGRARGPGSGGSRLPTHYGRRRAREPRAGQYPSSCATNIGPERVYLADDAVAELVAGLRQRKGDVRVQALEAAGFAPRAAEAEVELGPQATLFLVAELATAPQVRVASHRARPAFDAARRLESRHRRDEMPAGQPVGGRERLTLVVVGRLLGDGGSSERAAYDHPPERARRPA